jgi:L-fuconolactonase
MRIDAHQHFWSVARGDYGWLTPTLTPLYRDFAPADLKPSLDRHGIDRTVLVQAAPTVAETDYMLALADDTPWIAAVVGWIDFERPEQRRELERLARHPRLRGIRPMIQDIPDDDWMLRPDLDWAFRALVDLDLAFDALGFPRHLDNFLRLFQRYPKLRVTVDHGCKPRIRDRAFDGWAPGIERIARQTTAFCKVSGLVTESRPDWSTEDLKPYVEHLLACFGPGRLMFGSDWPVANLAGGYDSWWQAANALLGRHSGAADIFGGTAARFYRI